MPLFTYVLTVQGQSHVAQIRRSNYRGFIDWLDETHPPLESSVRKSLAEIAYRLDWTEVPNRKNVWRAIANDGDVDATVYAIRTDG